jgi:hypothetical protein
MDGWVGGWVDYTHDVYISQRKHNGSLVKPGDEIKRGNAT